MPKGVFIPPIIQRVVWAKTGFETTALQIALDDFIQIQSPQHVSAIVDSITMYLDEGEKPAIRLAASIKEKALLLLDDKAGRRTAKQLELFVTGTVGLLLLVKQKILIAKIMPLLK